ncbi:MAG: hypothetical protein QOI35_986 [Cryptosporangiaceae bacterium]|nr:hypothetical protein [Cryptosporangiaceae bacterium]MDQ1656889.1 hypothetical protein [Cryptosporangiaceae bacterium]
MPTEIAVTDETPHTGTRERADEPQREERTCL